MTVGHEIVGNGSEHVIVMHDWMSTRASYDGLLPFLDTDSFTYAFMDHRGYGQSRDIAGKHTAVEAAGDVIALADSLGWERFHVIGHSMSGMIAQRVSLDAPGRVSSLVAVTPVSASGVPLDADGEALFKGAATDDDKWKTVAKMVTSERLSERWYDAKLQQFRKSVDPEAFLEFLRMWTQEDFSSQLKDVATPVLIIVGEHDFEAFTVDAMRETICLWYRSAKIELLSGSGHYPMAETPVYFLTVVENFMKSVAA